MLQLEPDELRLAVRVDEEQERLAFRPVAQAIPQLAAEGRLDAFGQVLERLAGHGLAGHVAAAGQDGRPLVAGRHVEHAQPLLALDVDDGDDEVHGAEPLPVEVREEADPVPHGLGQLAAGFGQAGDGGGVLLLALDRVDGGALAGAGLVAGEFASE